MINFDRYLDHEWAMACQADDAEEGMVNLWGDRCSVYQEGCCACDAWKRFDETGEIVKP